MSGPRAQGPMQDSETGENPPSAQVCVHLSVTWMCAQVHISDVSLKLHAGVSETTRHQAATPFHNPFRELKGTAVALSGGSGEGKQELTSKALSGLRRPVHRGGVSVSLGSSVL